MSALAAFLLSACGSSPRHTSAPTTTLLETDRWTAPAAPGAPSPEAFCAVLTDMYQHEADLPMASPAVKKQILRDFVSTVPVALAAAPPAVAPATRTYLTNLVPVLNALIAAGLDYKKLPAGTLTPLLLDPNIKAAGNQVLAYSTTVCHYTIGGPPTEP